MRSKNGNSHLLYIFVLKEIFKMKQVTPGWVLSAVTGIRRKALMDGQLFTCKSQQKLNVSYEMRMSKRYLHFIYLFS